MSLENDYEPDSHVVQVQELFITHQPVVRGFILSKIPNVSLADDLVQETFLTVTRKAHSFKLGTSFLAWVRTIAHYKILEAVRANSSLSFSEEVLEALSADRDDFPDSASIEVCLQHLDHCVSKLTPQARKAIEMRYSGGYRLPEIARLLGCTVPSASVTLSRARAFLRDCLDQRLRTSMT